MVVTMTIAKPKIFTILTVRTLKKWVGAHGVEVIKSSESSEM